MDDPTLESLLQNTVREEADWLLAAQHVPHIKFDVREPFLPDAAGYTIFRHDGTSSSFPREIQLVTPQYQASTVIEYAIWWDWDIEHLYELEHVWVYLDPQGNIVHGEASWHGGHQAMITGDQLSVADNRLVVFSEPGKHAFAAEPGWFQRRIEKTMNACQFPGQGGVWVTPLFEGIINTKSVQNDMLVQQYLQQHAFEPSFDFSQDFILAQDMLVPWPDMYNWIPHRVNWWLDRIIS